DPYGYLSSIGISKAQFAHDIAHGIGGKADSAKKPAKKSGKKSSWVKKPGTFILGKALKLHTSPHISAPAIAKLPNGSAIKYDAVLQVSKRLWLRQPRANGYGYIVGKDKYGKTMGKFK
ncbi:MAG: lysin, partial [Lactobacillus sp.]|nr:lysin [Lactobacillus sp.]